MHHSWASWYEFIASSPLSSSRGNGRDDFTREIIGWGGGRGSWRKDKWDSHALRRARFPLGFQEYEETFDVRGAATPT